MRADTTVSLAILISAVALVEPATLAAQSDDSCPREQLLVLLGLEPDEVADVDCLSEGARTVVVAAPALTGGHTPTVVLATVEGGRVLVRAERSLTALHPDHPMPLTAVGARLSVVAMEDHRMRVGIGLSNGEDEWSATEIAWIVEVDPQGRFLELGAILGDQNQNSFGECDLARRATIRVSETWIDAEYTYERRFEAQGPGRRGASVAQRRRQCRFRGPQPREARRELRRHRLPALTTPAPQREFPDSWFIELPRELEGQELQASRVVAAAWAARFRGTVDEYLAHFDAQAQVEELTGQGRRARLQTRSVAPEIRSLRRRLEDGREEEQLAEPYADGAGLRWASAQVVGDRATVWAGLSVASFSGEEGTYYDGVFELSRADGRWRITRMRTWMRYYGYYDDQAEYHPLYWRVVEADDRRGTQPR